MHLTYFFINIYYIYILQWVQLSFVLNKFYLLFYFNFYR